MLTGNIPVQGLHAKKRGALCLGQGGRERGGLPILSLSHPPAV